MTGDSNLHKLRCIRAHARETAYFSALNGAQVLIHALCGVETELARHVLLFLLAVFGRDVEQKSNLLGRKVDVDERKVT